jgi:nucleoside 2-deoxyribosyltransferase
LKATFEGPVSRGVVNHAAKALSAAAIREDKQEFVGDIVQQIEKDIRDSSAVVADLSESKADVLYEVGFAHALNRPTIHICSTPLDQLPFDVRNVNTLKYVKGQTHKLRETLENRLRAIFP